MSRVFINCVEAQKELKRDLFKLGIPVKPYSYQNKIVKDNPEFETVELQGYSYSILDFSDRDQLENLTLDWCKEEFKERISDEFGLNPGKAYKLREELWSQFLVNGRFDYTYHDRMHYQISPIIKELKEHPSSRQAIISIHNNLCDLEGLGGNKRIPCSMFYQLLIREGKLDLYYIQRSCDFLTHWANDVWLAIQMLLYTANELKINTGKFFHFITSLHAYKKDYKEIVY